MKPVEVTCAIIFQGKKILITQRNKGMSRAGKWEFPGGKIEKNETADQCIVREIQEELNLNIKILQWLEAVEHTYPEIKIRLIPCMAKISSGTILAREHSDLKWVNAEDLMSFDWSPADVHVVKQLLKLLRR